MAIKKKYPEGKLNVLISDELKKKYKYYCLDNNFIISKRIRELIEKDLRGEIK